MPKYTARTSLPLMHEIETIYKVVQPYLRELGYPDSSIKLGVKTGDAKADIVVYDSDEAFIVVEVKTSNRSLPDKEDLTLLKFHPDVRQVQSLAASLNAPFFLLTNGVSFLWFKTDESGRPSLLDSAVHAPATLKFEATEAPLSRDELVQAFQTVQAHLFINSGYALSDDAAVLILAKLMSDAGNDAPKRSLIEHGEVYEDFAPIKSLSAKPTSSKDRMHLEHAFELLDLINIKNASPQDLLSALDEVFIDSPKGYKPKFPRWLSDLLVQLAQLNKQSYVVDINSFDGDILAAASILPAHARPSSVVGIARSADSAMWAMIQQLILNQSTDTILFGDPLHIYGTRGENRLAASHVITILPIGAGKVQTFYDDFQLARGGEGYLEDVYLELGVKLADRNGRLVVLVPEGLLFASKRKAVRRFLQHHTRIRAIISLPNGALSPFANIKTDILVLDGKRNENTYDIFMSAVDKVAGKNIFFSNQIPQIQALLNDYQSWTEGHSPGINSWVVSSSELKSDNFTTTFYNPSLRSEKAKLAIYPEVSLNEIAKFIRRGVGIRLDDTGEIPVIGPAAIRPMQLDATKISGTTKDKLPRNAITVQTGDVVVNNISTHLGSAAVVDESVAGSYISQHVLLITPNESLVRPQYLAAALNSDTVKAQIQQLATGTLLPSLTRSRLSNIVVPLPDLSTQQQIVSNIEQARQELLNAEKALHEAEAKFSYLIGSLSTGEDKQ